MKITNIDATIRSLLQKAVRRGAPDIAEKAAIYLILNKQGLWLKNRLGTITFEESWGYTSKISFNKTEKNLINQYKALCTLSKNKNAAGLGSLAYELSKGDKSALQKEENLNRHIKIVKEAINRPKDFWNWAKSENRNNSEANIFLDKAETGYNLAGWPWDKAFSLASAYLILTSNPPELIHYPSTETLNFPFWTAIDKHTPKGKTAIKKCSEKLNINHETLGWIQFYFESAKTKNLQESIWWEKEKNWRLEREGISIFEANHIWSEAALFLETHLTTDSAELSETLEKAHQQYVNTIKNQGNLL